MYQAIVTFVSDHGWFFAERLDDSSRVFVHQNDVENQRYLKVNDRIEFEIGPSRTIPGKTCAVNVRYLGHLIARQVGDQMVQS